MKVIAVLAAQTAALWCTLPASAADLTATEQRWLKGAWPVVTYARATAMPLDIIVQPQPTPGEAPLGMAFIRGRCKLVLSMRGNPQAEATLDAIDPALLNVTLELMAAHELGHCKRYLDGLFDVLPAGFAAADRPADLRNRQSARLEEGFGDLVGLAWIQQQHPAHYAALYAWLLAERSKDRVPGSAHDTLAWLRLVPDGFAPGLGADSPSTIFSMSAWHWPAGFSVND